MHFCIAVFINIKGIWKISIFKQFHNFFVELHCPVTKSSPSVPYVTKSDEAQLQTPAEVATKAHWSTNSIEGFE